MRNGPTNLPYPWFDRACYDDARELMVDGAYWPADYETWHVLAKGAMARLSVDGVTAVRQTIALPEFAAWCHDNDRPTDSDSRLTFAAIQWRKAQAREAS